MKIDSTTPVDELIAAVRRWDKIADGPAARAELARRSELAAKYERLTRALVLIASLHIEVKQYGVIAWGKTDGSATIDHNGTPDSIADAIIAAAEAER